VDEKEKVSVKTEAGLKKKKKKIRQN